MQARNEVPYTMSKREKEVIIITPAWPSVQGGQAIAVKSLLIACLQVFSKTHVIGITTRPFDAVDQWNSFSLEWTHAKTVSQPKWLRFARSLFSRYPAVTAKYQRGEKKVIEAVARILKKSHYANRELFIIVEDVPTACVVPELRKQFPSLRIAIRSENLYTTAYEGLTVEGSYLRRLPWKLEVSKLKRFEKMTYSLVNQFWAITSSEAENYRRHLGIEPDGIMGVCLNAERYRDVEPGSTKTVIHVGTVDLRKGRGILDFIRRAWPVVRDEIPDARLVLAGRGSERFTNENLGIEGIGFVNDDLDVLRRGQVFVNPQQIGSGLQLKSIVAMLAGKALVSTRMGAEGVRGKDGEHLVVARTVKGMATQIVSLIQDSERAHRIGERSRDFATKFYCERHFLIESKPLLEEFVTNTCETKECT